MRTHDELADDYIDLDELQVTVYRVKNDVFFRTGINTQSCCRLIMLLKEAEEEGLTKPKQAKPIVLTLSTLGGSVYAALGVVDAICALKIPVHTVVSGMVASAGTIISLAGSERFIGANSYMLIHEVRSSNSGKFSELVDDLHNVTRLNDHIVMYYGKCTGLTDDQLRTILSRNKVWDAKQCKENNFVDVIL
jgi:ATP-dependent Clp protease, protease subunit